MSAPHTAPNRSETFGRLLSGAINSIATYEGKTAPIVEDELGQQIGIAGKTIQRYKAGHLPPEARTVLILASAAVQRGFLGREWLQRFLHAARYHQADALLDQLCPLGPARPRPPRIYENLPAPTYSQFVMREQAFSEVIDGLQQRSAAVLIIGLGGNGKTSLAREVAAACLRDDAPAPRFDSVVWVSDKDHPGATNLSTVLDEIARTLDYPGFTQLAHDEKRREVEQLLRRQRVLLVVDNFETITDRSLLSWLLRLPEPSKALITTREYARAFRNSTMVVELRGMREAEAHALVNQRLRTLRMEAPLGVEGQLEPLLAATGGNPKAIELTLGLVKYEHRPLPQVVDDLYAARGFLFDDLFARSWALLDEAARRVLLVATFFPASASAAALSASADISGYAFEQAVERLADLALLDVQHADLSSTPRYALHPLVRAFAGAKWREQPGFEAGARARWVRWYQALVAPIGYAWDYTDRLAALDPEHEAIITAITWAMEHGDDEAVVAINRGAEYYYYIGGLWDKKQLLNQLAADAARRLGRGPDAVHALASQVHLLSLQDRFSEAAQYLPALQQLVASEALPGDHRGADIALMLYWLRQGAVAQAQQILEESFERHRAYQLTSALINRRWYGYSVYLQGHAAAARQILTEVLEQSRAARYARGVLFCQLKLVALYLDAGELDRAERELAAIQTSALHDRARRDHAEASQLSARLHALRGDIPAARAALAEAIDLFERLGMRRELAEARAELARLEA